MNNEFESVAMMLAIGSLEIRHKNLLDLFTIRTHHKYVQILCNCRMVNTLHFAICTCILTIFIEPNSQFPIILIIYLSSTYM